MSELSLIITVAASTLAGVVIGAAAMLFAVASGKVRVDLWDSVSQAPLDSAQRAARN